MPERIKIDEPLWDQSSFIGRFKHFFWVTDPLTCMVKDEELDKAKILVEQYRLGKEPKGTTNEQVIYAKKLYESAFHPDSGERQNVFGRMSFQVPGGMLLTGAMLQFYRTSTAVVFWQWVNQSFNALVNFTNRNAKSEVSTTQLGIAYVSATASAMITALGYKAYLQKTAGPFMQRYVPFAAVAAANCVNIPLMRQAEWMSGIDVVDDKNNIVGQSKLAAGKGITQVIMSRITMCAPGMLILPVIMERLEKYAWMKRITYLHAPMQVMFVGGFLIFMVPVACGLFPQKCSLKTSTLEWLEPEAYKQMLENTNNNIPERIYFNKGL
ncbi:PREDICTED: sideroflexin-2 [Nicrophorus vespilloides]|uniref:Sidoreflexin n=1 Tax=Nicrophorus vespilloides TaxID=110193 RepID=A0ABM1N964_NICVS|nr:PREDICTED: sideroflexin-2 [Nicrophorus vespilloides]XP_017783364.1 PREDICTED: sideroflexin-2 [Nicrophorus vespilloides]